VTLQKKMKKKTKIIETVFGKKHNNTKEIESEFHATV